MFMIDKLITGLGFSIEIRKHITAISMDTLDEKKNYIGTS